MPSLFVYVPENLISGTFIPPYSLLVWVALLINVTSKPQADHYRRPRLSAHYRPPCGLPKWGCLWVLNGGV